MPTNMATVLLYMPDMAWNFPLRYLIVINKSTTHLIVWSLGQLAGYCYTPVIPEIRWKKYFFFCGRLKQYLMNIEVY